MARRFKPPVSTVVEIVIDKEEWKSKEIRIECRDVRCKKCGEEFLSDLAKCWESDNPARVYCECPNPECGSINHILRVKTFL